MVCMRVAAVGLALAGSPIHSVCHEQTSRAARFFAYPSALSHDPFEKLQLRSRLNDGLWFGGPSPEGSPLQRRVDMWEERGSQRSATTTSARTTATFPSLALCPSAPTVPYSVLRSNRFLHLPFVILPRPSLWLLREA